MRLAVDVRFPLTDQPIVEGLSRRIPGLRVRRSGSGGATFFLPDHAAALAWPVINSSGWSAHWRDPQILAGLGASLDYAGIGRQVLRRLETEGVLRPGVADSYYDYQVPAVGYACARGSGHLWQACAAGKTREAFAWALSVPGPVVFVTRVALTLKVAREVCALTNLEPHLWLPPSRRRKSYTSTADYLSLFKADDTAPLVPFVIVGQENLLDAMPDLLPVFSGGRRPGAVVFDEVHRLASWHRWEASMEVEDDGDGRGDGEAPTAPSGEGRYRLNRDAKLTFNLKDNIAAAAYQLSRAARRRLGLTATPIPDRVRNLWSPLDLVDPREWGGFYDYAYRYAAARPGSFGGIDTTGASHLNELQARLEWVAWNTPLEVVQAALPPFREDVVWLTPENLVEPAGGWKRELKQAARGGTESILEAHLAMTASRKRRWTVGQVVDALKAGQKVLVFTGRRRDAEEIAGAVERTVGGSQAGDVNWCHGGLSPEQLQGAVDTYMVGPGPSALVATYDSIGDGQDLQDTDLCLAVMLPYSPHKATQMKGRVSRPGQTRPVLFRWVIGQGTIDERVLSILSPKLGNVAGILGDSSAAMTGEVLRAREDQEALLEELAAIVAGGGEWAETEEAE